MLYTGKNSGSKTLKFTYDPLNRLTNSVSADGTLNEQISYDLMGNITQLTRGGQAYSTLSYSYENNNQSNHLSSVTGSGFPSRSYAYDGNGNATTDGNVNSLTKNITYNLLNLPQSVTQNGTVLATYTYDANGQKLRSTGSDGNWDYINGIIYHNGVIDNIQTEEGRAIPANGYTYQYHLKDHLGNVRASFYKNTTGNTTDVIQESEYYAFGLNRTLIDNGNKYLYNNKEKQIDLNNQFDYGARFYDPVIGRWTSVDPLAELERRGSPYGYTFDDPIRHTDPDGMFGEDVVDDDGGGDGPAPVVKSVAAVGASVVIRSTAGQIMKQAILRAGAAEVIGLGPENPAADIAAVGLLLYGGYQALQAIVQSSHNSESSEPQAPAPSKDKGPPNPNGAKGNPDHQDKVQELAEKAKAEHPGSEVIQEKKIRLDGSNRRPDVQVVNPKTGKTTKVYEAERKPNSSRNKKRQGEYDKLGIDHETHKVGN